MEQNKPKKSLALTEEQKAALLKAKAEREQRMKTDPEYKAMIEKRHRKLEKNLAPLIGDSWE